MMVIARHLGKAVMLRIAKRLNAADLLRSEISAASPVEVMRATDCGFARSVLWIGVFGD